MISIPYTLCMNQIVVWMCFCFACWPVFFFCLDGVLLFFLGGLGYLRTIDQCPSLAGSFHASVFWMCTGCISQDCNLNKCIPLIIHGDDADSHRRRSFMILTLGSLLTFGSMFDSKLLVYCLDNACACESTYSTLDAWIVWSLTELQLGHYLDVDPYGEQYPRYPRFAEGRSGLIAEGWKGIAVMHKGAFRIRKCCASFMPITARHSR